MSSCRHHQAQGGIWMPVARTASVDRYKIIMQTNQMIGLYERTSHVFRLYQSLQRLYERTVYICRLCERTNQD